MKTKKTRRSKKAVRGKRAADKKLLRRSVRLKRVSVRVAGGAGVVEGWVSPESSRSIRASARKYSKALASLARR